MAPQRHPIMRALRTARGMAAPDDRRAVGKVERVLRHI